MTARQWMPLYVPDYLRDTSHLSTLEHGAYLLLLMHYWTKGSLPANEAQLARISRLTPKEWKGMRETLAGLFQEGWKHKRVEKEIAEAQARYERRANAGREGGNARANAARKRVEADVEHDNEEAKLSSEASIATALPEHCSGNEAELLPAMPPTHAGARDRAQPSQSHFSTEKITTLDAGAKRDLDLIENRLRDAARLERSDRPGLKVLAPILGLMDQGLSLDEDILPVVRARSHAGVNSWAFFTGMILDAKAARNAAATARGRTLMLPSTSRDRPAIDRPRSGSASAMAGVMAAATKFGEPR